MRRPPLLLGHMAPAAVIALLLAACGGGFKPIKPPKQPLTNITVGRHSAVALTDDQARQTLAEVATLLGNVDSVDDVACPVATQLVGSVSVYGSDISVINSDAEFDQLMLLAEYVKVVSAINYCGRVGSFAGCAPKKYGGMAVVRQSTVAREGSLWAHEYGHNMELDHVCEDPHCTTSLMTRLMYPSLSSQGRAVVASECQKFRALNPALGDLRRPAAPQVAVAATDSGVMSPFVGKVASCAGPSCVSFSLVADPSCAAVVGRSNGRRIVSDQSPENTGPKRFFWAEKKRGDSTGLIAARFIDVTGTHLLPCQFVTANGVTDYVEIVPQCATSRLGVKTAASCTDAEKSFTTPAASAASAFTQSSANSHRRLEIGVESAGVETDLDAEWDLNALQDAPMSCKQLCDAQSIKCLRFGFDDELSRQFQSARGLLSKSTVTKAELMKTFSAKSDPCDRSPNVVADGVISNDGARCQAGADDRLLILPHQVQGRLTVSGQDALATFVDASMAPEVRFPKSPNLERRYGGSMTEALFTPDNVYLTTVSGCIRATIAVQ